jgi:hypothetical protein
VSVCSSNTISNKEIILKDFRLQKNQEIDDENFNQSQIKSALNNSKCLSQTNEKVVQV